MLIAYSLEKRRATLFNRARSREIERFATELAREFAEKYPLAEAQGERNVVKKLARAIDDACDHAAAIQKDKRLGVYGKAKLGTRFKYELKELGYDDKFVDEILHNVLLRIAR